MSKVPLRRFEASGLALAGYTAWVFADTFLKIAGAARVPAYEVLALVGVAIVASMLLYGAGRRRLAALWPKNPGRQVLRSLLDVINNTGVVVALRHLPLPLFYILVFACPMVTTLLAAVFLREVPTWRQRIAIVTGFLGVVVAVNPFGLSRTGDWIGYLACAICVCAFSANMVWSRVLTQTETPESLTFFSGAVVTVVGLAATAFHPAPVSARLIYSSAASGAACVVGSLCFYFALRRAAASTVSQYHYSQLLTGTLVAYLLWHETLTTAMVLGAALIIASGWYSAVDAEREQESAEGAAGQATSAGRSITSRSDSPACP